jgi:hypothetical protein
MNVSFCCYIIAILVNFLPVTKLKPHKHRDALVGFGRLSGGGMVIVFSCSYYCTVIPNTNTWL